MRLDLGTVQNLQIVTAIALGIYSLGALVFIQFWHVTNPVTLTAITITWLVLWSMWSWLEYKAILLRREPPRILWPGQF